MAFYDNNKKGWIGDIRGLDLDVTPKRSTPHKTKKLAEAWENEQKEKGIKNVKTKKISEMCDLFLKSQYGAVEESTYTNKECIIRLHIKPNIGDLYIDKLRLVDIINWRNKLLERGDLSNYRINVIVKQMKEIFDFAESNIYLQNTPFKKLKRLIETKQKEYLTYSIDQFKKYYEVSVKDDIVFSSYFLFMFFSGCRPGEARALKWSDINLDTCICDINKTVNQKTRGKLFVLKPPKNKSSFRKFELDRDVVKALIQLKEYYSKFKGFNSNCFVFGMICPLPPSTVDKKNRKYAKLAELPRLTIHDFRHSHATFLLNSTSNKLNQTNMLLLVSQRLGHKDITETAETYAHLLNKNEEILIDVIVEEKEKADFFVTNLSLTQ